MGVNFGHRAASMELEAIEVIEEQKKKMVRPILESTITKSVNRARVRHVQSEVVDFAIDEARANSMSKNGLSAEMNAKVYGRKPLNLDCPYCQAYIQTKTTKIRSDRSVKKTVLSGTALFLFGSSFCVNPMHIFSIYRRRSSRYST